MLKVILMLDCNLCGQPFNRVTSSTDRDPINWKSLSLDLEYAAEESGWSSHRATHYCDYCVTDVMLAGKPIADVVGNRPRLVNLASSQSNDDF